MRSHKGRRMAMVKRLTKAVGELASMRDRAEMAAIDKLLLGAAAPSVEKPSRSKRALSRKKTTSGVRHSKGRKR
jgi:hypothetical protein